MITIFSHQLTQPQIQDAQTNLHVDRFLYLPQELQKLWSNVDTEQNINHFLLPVKNFIVKNYEEGDSVLIQGDYGASYNLISFCKAKGYKTLYATTKRNSKEIIRNNTVEKVSYFSHISYKEYQENDLH